MKIPTLRSALIVSLAGLATTALEASPTADYRFVPVRIPPVASLALFAKPNATRALSAISSGQFSPVDFSAISTTQPLSPPTGAVRFDLPSIRASRPIVPRFATPVTNPN